MLSQQIGRIFRQFRRQRDDATSGFQFDTPPAELSPVDIAIRTAITDHHPDAKEGGASFVAKRTPAFNAWLDAPNSEH